MFENRAMHGFNISVSTGIALNALYHNTIPGAYTYETEYDMVDLASWDTLYINLHTLTRNIITAMKTSEQTLFLKSNKRKELLKIVQEEIDIIKGITMLNNKKVVFYQPDYKQLFNIKGYGELRDTKKDRIIRWCMEIDSALDNQPSLTPTNRDILLTHMLTDLLIKGNYKLLRSHTGKVINRPMFGKLYISLKGMDMAILPVYKILISIFGDDAGYVRPAKPSYRRDVYERLLKEGVHPGRTEAWIKAKI